MKHCEEARSLSQYEALEKYSAQLLTQAQKQGNKRTETYAYFYNGLSKMFMGKGEEAQLILNKAHDLSTEINNDSICALVMNAKGIYQAVNKNNSFIAQQYFFRSLTLSKQAGYTNLQYRVRGNLLTLSHSVGDSIALENASMVYDYGVKQKNYEQMGMGAYYLATYYYKQNNYPQAENYLKIAIDTYKKYPCEDIAAVYSLYSKLMLSKGDTQKAEQLGKEAISLAQKYKQASMEVDASITYAEVLSKKHDYQQSNEMIMAAMKKAREIGTTNKDVDCYQIIAQNYTELGQTTEAMKYLKMANQLLSEQADINMERLSHEQAVMHEMEEKEMETKIKQEQIASQRLFLVMLSIVVVVLLILLVHIIKTYRHRNSLYKSIVLQNTQAIARQTELQKQIERLTKEAEKKANEPEKPTDKTASNIDDDKLDMLYIKLCNLMENERLYTEPQLNRERMAEILGTNRTYLTKMIKEKTGMNYLQFVNSYRINEAIRILSDKEKASYPLKQIWSDLGFSSPSTFFKLFQQSVGITPSTYRKQFLEVNGVE